MPRLLVRFAFSKMFAGTFTIVLLCACCFSGRAQNISLVGTNKPGSAVGFGDVWAEGNIACMGVWTNYGSYGIGIFDISNPASPQLITTYNYAANQQNRFEQGVIRNKILYVGSWGGGNNGSGLHILSLTNVALTNPVSPPSSPGLEKPPAR